jgi:hypothetical protein
MHCSEVMKSNEKSEDVEWSFCPSVAAEMDSEFGLKHPSVK